jgi:hypothetical protein
MSCERYWREGVLLVEQNRPDPHRDSCLDCRRQHDARGELVRAFELVGAHGGDPRWQVRVWQQIKREGRRPSMGWLSWAGAFATACVLIALVVRPRLGGDGGPGDEPPRVEIVKSKIEVRRLASAGVGDGARIRLRAAEEARIYHADLLLLRCSEAMVGSAAPVPGCARDGDGVRVELVLTRPGDYQVVILPVGSAEPKGSLDRDLAALAVGGRYELHKIAVR